MKKKKSNFFEKIENFFKKNKYIIFLQFYF